MSRNISDEKFKQKMEIIIKRVMKRIDRDNIYVRLEVDPTLEKSVDAAFCGNARHTTKSYIVIRLCKFKDLKEGSQKLRRWNATIISTLIHEYSHYLLFKEMNYKERLEALRKYTEYKYFRDKEEIETWNLTLKLLKRYRYFRSKALQSELKKFILPKGYKFPKEAFDAGYYRSRV